MTREVFVLTREAANDVKRVLGVYASRGSAKQGAETSAGHVLNWIDAVTTSFANSDGCAYTVAGMKVQS